ncbi:MAG: glycerophosphodiester phosphodiesterase [Acidimicrobiales bacterium]
MAPPPHPHPYLDVEGPIAFAHRGGAGVHPENTLRAFAHAVELGFTHVETDVHITADGVAIAFHNDVLDRVTDRRGRIADLPWSEVRRARVGHTEPICRLDELIDAFPDTRINLDPKHDAAVEPMVRVLAATNSVDRVCVCSFSDRRTGEAARRIGPRLCTGAGPRSIARLVARSHGAPLSPPSVHCAQVPPRWGRLPLVTRGFVDSTHRAGIQVHVWTIDDPDEMRSLLDIGVDGVMTDRPLVLREVLQQRAEWPAPPGRRTGYGGGKDVGRRLPGGDHR